MPRVARPLDVRLLEDSMPEPNSGCRLWLGEPNENGYGRTAIRIGWRQKHVYAHRLSYQVFVGPIPYGMEVDHTCRNRMCIEPRHLEVVTHAENVRRAKRAMRTASA